MIVESTYTADDHTQPDGSRWVFERHIDADGQDYRYQYLCPADMNPQVVMEARAARLNVLLAEKAAAQALVYGTMLPLTKLQFRELFTQPERASIDAFRAGLEQNPALSSEQKAAIRTGFIDFDNAQNIVRPFLPQVVAMLDLFVSLGLLTAERRAAIIEAGNG